MKQREQKYVNEFYKRVITLKHKNNLQDYSKMKILKKALHLGHKKVLVRCEGEMDIEEPIEDFIRKIERETNKSKKVKERIGRKKMEKSCC